MYTLLCTFGKLYLLPFVYVGIDIVYFWVKIAAFVAQLYPLNGLNSPNVDASPKSRYEERLSMDDADDDVDNGRHKEHYDRAEAYRGINWCVWLVICYLFKYTTLYIHVCFLDDWNYMMKKPWTCVDFCWLFPNT